MTDTNEPSKMTPWFKARELPAHVFEVWRKPNGALSPVAIVATVDPDGAPRAAPFGSLRAVTPCLLRFAPLRRQSTYVNLCRDGRVAVTVIAAPDIAVSVRGRARVTQERMDAKENRAVVDIDVEEVKNDMVPTIAIESGVMISVRAEWQNWVETHLGKTEGMA